MNHRKATGRLIAAWFLMAAAAASAGSLDLEVEAGGVWFTRNDTRIPGDTGTRFDMLDLTGSGPDAAVRLMGTYHFNRRHALRLTLAPLQVEGTGRLDRDVLFMERTFPAGEETTGSYRFNTYRLTYRWTFLDGQRWRLGAGLAALVRDAEIELEQDGLRQSRDDLGVVPLLHLYGSCALTERASLILDVEGSAASQGRAVDAALKGRYQLPSGWYATAGYRTIEGGSDGDAVYTFAWIHFAVVGMGYRF